MSVYLFKFEAGDFDSLVEILKRDADDEEVNTCMSFHTSMMMDTSKNELYLKSGVQGYLILSRIELCHRRQGYGTQILNCLFDYAQSKGYKGIMVESVLTEEMAQFCRKHGFVFDDRYSLDSEKEFGNWFYQFG